MGLFYGLWLVVLGILGAASLIVAKKPDAKELIDKLAPYQGWIGAISALWGIYVIVFGALFNMGLIKVSLIWWITILAQGVLLLALGLLLGVGVLKTFIKNAEAQAKMDQTIEKLAPKQGLMGLIAIGLGVWGILASFILV